MDYKKLLLLSCILALGACASHRQGAVCSEIRYRLDNLDYNDDQREWIEAEWETCVAERDSLAEIDARQYETVWE